LKLEDIDTQRMVIHIRHGKGGKDRDVPLSVQLLDTLRAYDDWMQPETYLFPAPYTAGAPTSPSRRRLFGRLARRRPSGPTSPSG